VIIVVILGSIVRRIVGFKVEVIGSTVGLKVNVLDVGAEVVSRDSLVMDGCNEYNALPDSDGRIEYTGLNAVLGETLRDEIDGDADKDG